MRCATSPGRVRLVCAHAKTGTYLTQGVVALVAALLRRGADARARRRRVQRLMDALGNPPLAPPPDLPPPLRRRARRPPPSGAAAARGSARAAQLRARPVRPRRLARAVAAGAATRRATACSATGPSTASSSRPLRRRLAADLGPAAARCAGAAAEAGAADRACESYGAYLRRRLADGGGGMRAVALATAARFARPGSGTSSTASTARPPPRRDHRAQRVPRALHGGRRALPRGLARSRSRTSTRSATSGDRWVSTHRGEHDPMFARVTAQHDRAVARAGRLARARRAHRGRARDRRGVVRRRARRSRRASAAPSPPICPRRDEERLARLPEIGTRDRSAQRPAFSFFFL